MGHTIEKCWCTGGGDECGGPRGCAQEKKRSLETENATIVEEKEETHISALADGPITTNPCTFHDSANHFDDGYWSNLAVEPGEGDSLAEMSLVDWIRHSLANPSTDTDV